MKLSRLLTYAAIGIISGLLVENKALIVRYATKEKVRRFKKDINKKLDHQKMKHAH